MIKISGTEMNNPLIEASVPSSTMIADRQFKLGNSNSDRAKWMFFSDKKIIYSFRVLDASQEVNEEDFLRIRDAGGLSSFSRDQVCTTGFRCILLSNCIAK